MLSVRRLSHVYPGSRIPLLSISILISIISGNLKLNLVDVSSSKDVRDGGRLLLVLLLQKKLLLSQLFFSLLLQKKLSSLFLFSLLLPEFLLNSKLLLFSSQSLSFLGSEGIRDESHDLGSEDSEDLTDDCLRLILAGAGERSLGLLSECSADGRRDLRLERGDDLSNVAGGLRLRDSRGDGAGLERVDLIVNSAGHGGCNGVQHLLGQGRLRLRGERGGGGGGGGGRGGRRSGREVKLNLSSDG